LLYATGMFKPTMFYLSVPSCKQIITDNAIIIVIVE
jgi:hypothetical protein